MMRDWYREVADFLWSGDHQSRPRWQRSLLWTGRVLFRLVDDIATGDITLRAMSLVFTTLVAIVPLLAVSFSVLKGFGVHNQVEPLLLSVLAPLGDKGVEVTETIIGFVENIKVGVLGSLGLALLFYSAFSLIQKVEAAFNSIWRLKQRRTLMRRLSDYLSVLLVGPVLVFTALGVSAGMMSSDLVQALLAVEPLGSLYRLFARLLPYLLIIAAFTFFYIFIPNTRVRFRNAVCGGAVSGIVWQTASWGFAGLMVYSTRYTAIYSGFAILIFFMMWVYLNWLILLSGADLVYHLQHPEHLSFTRQRRPPGSAAREYLALQALTVVGKEYYRGAGGATTEQVARHAHGAADYVSDTLEQLKQTGLITESVDHLGTYLPARPFDSTTVKEALDAIRRTSELQPASGSGFEYLQALMARADKCLHEVFDEVSLKQLALEEPESREQP